MQDQIFDKPIYLIMMSQFVNLNIYMKVPVEAADLSTVKANISASFINEESKSEK